MRDRTIRDLAERYHVDLEQAARVSRPRSRFFEQVAGAVGARSPSRTSASSPGRRALHEIGLSIAYTGYHKHGAYIVEHSDMPGFSREDQELLAALIGATGASSSREPFDASPGASAASSRCASRCCCASRCA